MRVFHRSLWATVISMSCAVACVSGTEPDGTSTSSHELTSNGLSATLTLTSDWGAGYCADVKLVNTGAATISSWSVEVELASASLTNVWNGTGAAFGSRLKISPVAYNATLVATGSTSVGFCATGTARPTIVAVAVTSANTGEGGTTAKGGTSSVGGTTAKGGTSSVGGSSVKGGTSNGGGPTSTTQPAITVYIAGDSTVSNYTDTSSTKDQAGWGQMLPGIFNAKVTVVNRAVRGTHGAVVCPGRRRRQDPFDDQSRRLLPRPVRHERSEYDGHLHRQRCHLS